MLIVIYLLTYGAHLGAIVMTAAVAGMEGQAKQTWPWLLGFLARKLYGVREGICRSYMRSPFLGAYTQ